MKEGNSEVRNEGNREVTNEPNREGRKVIEKE